MIRNLIRKKIGIPIVLNYAKKIEKSAYDPYAYQSEALKKIVHLCGKTELGIRSGLAKIKTMEDARNLPVYDYEALRPEFEKIFREAKRGFFSHEKIKAISLTSGTTGGPKYIPITQNLINNFLRIGLSFYAATSNELKNPQELFDSKVLYLSALPHIYDSPAGLPVGFMSGYMNTKRNWLYKDLVYPTIQTAYIKDTQKRISSIFEEIKDQDIRAIVGFPAIIQLFTEKALSHFNLDYLQELWTNLSFCIFGGNFLSDSQIDLLKKRWMGDVDKKLVILEQYSSVEGFFGHTLHYDWPGLVFNPFDIFYQFKKNEHDAACVQMHELEINERYFLYITTPAGLVNYAMQDIIEITSVKPLTFKFIARAKEQISLVSEKIIISEIKHVINCFTKEIKVPINDFVVYLDCKEGNKLTFVLSTEIPNLEHAVTLLDNSLREVNPNYNEYRVNNTYALPKIIYKPPRFFSDYREKNLMKGNFKEKRLFMSEEEFHLEYN